jgi:hypothetical protein
VQFAFLQPGEACYRWQVSLTKGTAPDEPTPYAQAADFELLNNGVIVRPTRAYSVPGG